MIRLFTFVCFIPFLINIASAQTTSIEGIINTYTKVTNQEDEDCFSKITVTDASSFFKGRKALIIQMKGATIAEGDNQNFGEIQSYNGVGTYELLTIDSIDNNTLYTAATLLYTYDPASAVQLVSFPVYESVTTNDTITAPAWDGNIGGIVAFEATDELILDAPITVTGKGFSGGSSASVTPNNCNWAFPQNDFYYPDNSWRAALKGEGIAFLINGKEAGRGPQANGGGGANDHNAGGGGGGNAGRGGQGGRNFEPTTFGCKGNHPGLGGRTLDTPQNSLLFGGGGGAGHGNNNVSTNGAAGGGIILIKAQRITTNITNPSLDANGLNAETSGGDGAGGGGAGGTVFLFADEIINLVSINTLGGNGGTAENSNSNRCMGPGGGGGGGFVILNPQMTGLNNLAIDKEGGIAGISVNSNSCSDGNNEATAGQTGQHLERERIEEAEIGNTQLTIVGQSLDPTICAGETARIEVDVLGNDLNYQWQYNDGTGWINIPAGPIFSGSESPELTVRNVNQPLADTYQYRCLISNACSSLIFSDPVRINLFEELQIIQQPVFNGTICVGDQINLQFLVNDNDANYQWQVDLGSGVFQNLTNSNVFSGVQTSQLGINVLVTTNYLVRCIIFDDCGRQVISDTIPINPIPLPSADFSFTQNGNTVQFTSTSINGINYTWNFGDGSPEQNTINTDHTFTADGTYTVQLTVTNGCGTDIQEVNITISTLVPPEAQFSAERTTGCTPLTVDFIDESGPGVISRIWSFPGGTPSTSTDSLPKIKYENEGRYDVILKVTSAGGVDSTISQQYIEVVDGPTADFSYIQDERTVTFTNLSQGGISYSWDFGDGSPLSSEENPVYTYADDNTYSVSLIVFGDFCAAAIGEDIPIFVLSDQSLEIENEIIVYPNPFQEQVNIINRSGHALQSISVFDAQGKLIYFSHPHQSFVSIESVEWSAGLYHFVVADQLGGQQMFRVIYVP